MVVASIIVSTASGNDPDVDTCANYADYYDLTIHVLADTDYEWFGAWTNGSSQHSYTVINSDGTVHWHQSDGSSTTQRRITNNLESAN